MKKFNNTDIFTGYLKQLLHNFNLPKLRIYTYEQQEYKAKTGRERYDVLETVTSYKNAEDNSTIYPEHLRYIPYIKDNKIQEFIDNAWVEVGDRNTKVGSHMHVYNYGNKLLNYTKNLKIKDNIYDSYTHEYLGDYLRFQRDYSGLDLMPLYNCFSNRACTRLKLSAKYVAKPAAYIPLKDFDKAEVFMTFMSTSDYIGYWVIHDFDYVEVTEENHDNLGIIDYPHSSRDDKTKPQTVPYRYSPEISGKFAFDTSDKDYKIYMVPVKLFKTYTIALDCDTQVEMCCGIYGNYQDSRKKFNDIYGLTYKKLSHCAFASPVLYTELLNLNQFTLGNSLVELAQSECDLKLFIKLPVNNTSTIVILEGDYLNWTNYTYKRPELQILNIDDWGANRPSLDPGGAPIPPAGKEYLIYLDTTHYNIYKTFKEADNSYTWKNQGLIWKEACIENTDKSLNTLIIDDQPYYRQYIAQEIIDEYEYDIEHGIEPSEELKAKIFVDLDKYFEAYRANKPSVSVDSKTAYFNTYIKKLFINCVSDWEKRTNHAVIDIENVTNEKHFDLITPLQLLRMNTNEQHPFADRLIEYLLENSITNREDEITDNIKRVQKALSLNYDSNNYFAKYPGIWEYRINQIIYDYINLHKNTYGVNHDILGYVDKDAEKYYAHIDTDKRTGKKVATSIANIELTEEEK